jgi:hypothetical protein
VTEEEWLNGRFAGRMLEYTRRITHSTWAVRSRKYRFAALAVVRSALQVACVGDAIRASALSVLEVAERVWAEAGDRTVIRNALKEHKFPEVVRGPDWGAVLSYLAHEDAVPGLKLIFGQTDAIRTETGFEFVTTVCALLRDIFGNPFRPVQFKKAWRTDTAVALARTMYDSREFSAMPILADALQDAGCEDEQVLNHCRDATAPHVRGCWVCDLVLSK